MAPILYACYPCPLGYLRIGHDGESVHSIKCTDIRDSDHEPSPVSDLANDQLQVYFSGRCINFNFPITVGGTPFQRSVWAALQKIPYGETRTYGQIAQLIGNPGAARAVGMACNKNPLWIVVPCHRVIGAKGALTGFEGGLDMKQALLDSEHN